MESETAASSGANDGDLLDARRAIRALREQLASAERESENLREQLLVETAKNHHQCEQLRAIRRSASWRLTWPMRAFNRHLRSTLLP